MMDWSKIIPPQPPKIIQVDYAEFIALRVVVMALIADKAIEHDALSGDSAQSWINDISILCQESVIASDISANGDKTGSRIRAKVLEKINEILGGVRLPSSLDNPDSNA